MHTACALHFLLGDYDLEVVPECVATVASVVILCPKSRCLIQRLGECDETETKVATTSLGLALEEAPHAEVEGLLTEYILVCCELATVERTPPPAVQLPQVVVRRLDEAHVVQIDLVIGGWRTGVAATRSALVGALESFRFVEQVSSLSRFQWNGVLNESRQVRVGL